MDRVKLYAQERLDLDDANALQSLVYDYVQEALGGLFGRIRGALSVPTITQTENSGAPYIELSAFQFVTTAPISASAQSVTSPSSGLAYSQMKTIVVTYDPTEETSTQISIDTPRAYYQDYVDAYLWARPIQRDTDTATRAQWSVAQGDEITFSDETRSSQRVEFAVQRNAPTYADGEAAWAPIARITGWTDADNTDSLAQWQIESAYENDLTRQFAGSYLSGDTLTRPNVTLDTVVNSLSTYPMESGASPRVLGVADQLALLRYKIAQLQGHGANDPSDTQSRAWYTAPLVSANGVDARLNTIESQRTSPIVCIAAGLVQVNVNNARVISYNLLTNEGISAIRTSPTRGNRMCVELDADLLAEDWRLLHVDVSQVATRKDNGDNTHDYNRVHAQIGDVLSGLLSDSNSYRLDDFSTSSGRGVNIELLALEQSSEESIAEDFGGSGHPDVIGTAPAVLETINLTLAIYAIHDDQDNY